MKKTNIKQYERELYRGNMHLFFGEMFVALLSSFGNIVISWMIKILIDMIGGYDTGFSLMQIILITVIVSVGCFAAYMISCFVRPKFISRGISQYKEYVFGELTKKNISAFSGENTATYISSLTNDINIIEKGYLKNIFNMTQSILTFVGAIALMIWTSPTLTLVAVCLSTLPVIASIAVGDKMASAEKSVSDHNEDYTGTLKDCLTGFPVIKSFKAEAQMIGIFKEKVKSIAIAECSREKLAIVIEMLSMLAGIFTQFGVFIVGAYLAMTGSVVTGGTTILFVQLMNYILGPIGVVPTFIAERKSAKTLITKVAEALSESTRDDEKDTKLELSRAIDICDLTFGYDADKNVLNEINFTFEAGKKYAIVGASGSGKSTLLNLLMSSYHNYSGEINFDDTELRQISSSTLYDTVSMIQQSVFIFNATIRDNITMFRDFPKEDVERAIEQSGLSDLILEKGEDYLCGEGGCGLSGGEKQRISIARSLLKKSKVLLVDEATAALDKKTAHQVSNSILALDGITAIVVTHALDEELLEKYDTIITLKDGTVIESGNFDDLFNRKGYFYSLFTISQ